jgi:hypothetical protein
MILLGAGTPCAFAYTHKVSISARKGKDRAG